MATITAIPTGYPVVIKQNKLYALPSKIVIITASKSLEVSDNGVLWDSLDSGAAANAKFIRSVGSDALLTCKGGHKAAVIIAPSPEPITPGTIAFTGQVLSATKRSNYTGTVGCRFKSDVNITAVGLGRWKIAGNSRIHNLYLCDSLSRILTSVAIDMSSGLADGYVFVVCDPIFLSKALSYSIVSSEISSQDEWYNGDTAITPVAGITGLSSAYTDEFLPPLIVIPDTPGPKSFCPLNFKFDLADNSIVTTAFLDTFTAANGTLINSRLADTGQSWQASGLTIVINNNKATTTGQSAAGADAGLSDGILTFDLSADPGGNPYTHIGFRRTAKADGNGLKVFWTNAGAGGPCSLSYKRDSTVLYDSGFIFQNSSLHVTITMNGASIRIQAVDPLSVSIDQSFTTDYLAGTMFHMDFYNLFGVTNSSVDNMKFTTLP